MRNAMNTKSLTAIAVLIVAATVLVSVVYARQISRGYTSSNSSTDAVAKSLGNGLVEFDEVILNLASANNENHFLRMSAVFVVDEGNEQRLTDAIIGQKPRLLNSLFSVGAETQVSDLHGKGKLTEMAATLREKLNSVLTNNGHEPFIKEVLFQDFNVQ